jgi:hypothetical protein
MTHWMSRSGSWIGLVGILIMTLAGQRLSSRVDVSWEVAAFGVGIIMIAITPWWPLAKRVDDLEKKLAGLQLKT